ncbi:MAG: hypothetical protein ABR947_01220 [Solirubrobacteraceae bacterium]|jgi:hypothetical protein
MRPRILGLAAVLVAEFATLVALLLAGAGPAQAGGVGPAFPRTTAPDLFVTVYVTMTNTRFILSLDSGPRGADAKFVIHNTSNKPHDFALGRRDYGEGNQTGFTALVQPGKTKILILFLDVRGKIAYGPGLAADRNKPGMKGTFSIGPCTHYEQVTGVGVC